MIRFVPLVAVFLVLADPAHAGIGAAVTAAVTAIKASATLTFFAKVAAGALLSLLGQALQKQPDIKKPGLKIPGTTTGEDVSQEFMLGPRATSGHVVYRNSHGRAGKTPNAFLTEVIEVSDIPGITLESLIINDRETAILSDEHPQYGFELAEFRSEGGNARAWIKWYDGTQTTADPYLVEEYGGLDEYEWSADHIGSGIAYAILTYRRDRKVFPQRPTPIFVVSSVKLYDPRKDTTVGGSGAHRSDDPSTWEASANNAVQVYNVLRGIPMPTGEIYGGSVNADDLPLSNWVAAMNVCDVDIGGRKQFRSSIRVRVAEDEPHKIVSDILRGGLGQIAEVGGVWRVRFGPPAAPVYSFTDDDISMTDRETLEPIKGLQASQNAIMATYVDPTQLWQPRTTEVLRNAAWEAEDGGRLLIAEVELGTVTSSAQATQVITSLIKDERRQRQHTMTLLPEAMGLSVLDDVRWTSAENGYENKDFEVGKTSFRATEGLFDVTLRERDPADFDWSASDDPPAPAPYVALPVRPAQTVPTFSVAGYVQRDGANAARRPAVRLSWDSEDLDDLDGVRWQVRRSTGSQPIVGQGIAPIDDGEKIVTEGIIPGEGYQARAQMVVDRPTAWTSWISAVAPNVFFLPDDFGPNIPQVFADAGLIVPEVRSSLPSSGNFAGRLVYRTTDNRLYRWDGGWEAFIDDTTPIDFSDLDGQIESAQIANGAIVNAKMANLAVTAEKVANSAITTAKIANAAIDAGKLASNSVTTLKIANAAVQAAKLADGAATEAKIATDAITETKITSNAITSPKIAAGAVVAGKLAAGSVQAGNVAAGAIQAGNIAAGTIVAADIAAATITGAKISAGTIEAGNIGAGAVTTAKLDALAVTAQKIAAGSIETDKLAANAVVADKINANAVTAAKISAGAVTTAKLDALAVTSDKIAANAITAVKIAAGTITADKIGANQITAGLIAAGAVSADKVQLDGVTLEGDGTGKLIIKSGGVDTGQLAENAATIPTSVVRSGSTGAAGRTLTPGDSAGLGATTVTREGGKARIQFDLRVFSFAPEGENVFIDYTITGPSGTIRTIGSRIYRGPTGFLLEILVAEDAERTGASTYTLLVSNRSSNSSTILFEDVSTFIMETKR